MSGLHWKKWLKPV